MRLFDALLCELLGPAALFHVEPGPDGFPHIVLDAGRCGWSSCTSRPSPSSPPRPRRRLRRARGHEPSATRSAARGWPCAPGRASYRRTCPASVHIPPTDALRAWIAEAGRGLAEGSTAYALALGLYLHWLDRDDLRAEAGQLLLDAYTAEGHLPFVEILRAHLLHRDLGSVGVFVD